MIFYFVKKSFQIFRLKRFGIFCAEFLCRITTGLNYSANHLLFLMHWGLPPTPEFFDHRLDLGYLWPRRGHSVFPERGVWSSFVLKEGGSMLELACGDGFCTRYFYAVHCREVIACDFDPKAVHFARQHHPADKIKYVLADIRTQMPEGDFDNIVLDAAIEHFTPDEQQTLLGDIRRRLRKKHGILSGYTNLEAAGGKAIPQHEHEFGSKEELRALLLTVFRYAEVFQTHFPELDNLYFYASDDELPLIAAPSRNTGRPAATVLQQA